MPTGVIRRVHHLNCGSFWPWRSGALVTHVLLCEMEHGLVLVDVGIGTADIDSPDFRLGRSPRIAGAELSVAETALNQVHGLGFTAADVTDVVATHLDYDHIGGLSDFPDAKLHVTALELAEAKSPAHTRGGNIRYRPAHSASIRSVETYDEATTTVVGLDAIELVGISGLFLVPMPGHTLGHSAVAVEDPDRGWLLHAGDSFLHHSSVSSVSRIPLSARAIRGLELFMASDRGRVRDNHFKLRRLAESGVRVFCSHDSAQYAALRNEGVSLAYRR